MPTIPPYVVLLLSGGLDSQTLAHELVATKCAVHAVLFDYQQPQVAELQFAKACCKRLGIQYTTLPLPPLGGLNRKSWIVKNRNAILLHTAANKALELGAESLFIGCNADDRDYFPDCRQPFIDSINRSLELAGFDIKVWAPYVNLTKREIADKAREYNVPVHEIWSCYQPKNGKQCGRCPACLKLKAALAV